MNELIQEIVIGVIVAASFVYAVRRLAPSWSKGRQRAFAQWLVRPGRNGLARAMGRFLKPGEGATGCGSGSSSGCSTCSTCGTEPEQKAADKDDVKPLHFHRHS